MKAKKLLPLLLAAVMGMSVLTGCSNINADATGATLDEKEISLGFMNFMARYEQASYDGYYGAMFGSDFWSQDLSGSGSDMETTVKEQVAGNIEVLYLLEQHMGDYGIEITDEELDAMDKAAEKFMSDNSKAAIKQVGATKEYVKEMLRLNTIQKKVKDATDTEVDTEVSDEEAAQKTFSYVKVSKTSATNEDGESVNYSDEEKEELKTTIAAYAETAKTDFEKAAEDAGYTVSTYSYGKDEDSFAEAVITQADKMKDGEISGLLEDDENYYVIRMDSTFDKEKTEEKKEEIVEQRKTDHYAEVCDGYKEGVKYEVNEKEWEKVKFEDVFTLKQAETEDTDEGDGTDESEGSDETDGTDENEGSDETDGTDENEGSDEADGTGEDDGTDKSDETDGNGGSDENAQSGETDGE